MSDRLRKLKSDEEWGDTICGMSNPHHQAFEVTNGKKLSDGRIAFDVQLYEHYSYQPDWGRVLPIRRIVLAKIEPETWHADDITGS